MEQKPKQSTENFIKEIRRKTRRLFSSEQKLVIVMEAQRGEYSIAFFFDPLFMLIINAKNGQMRAI